MAFKKPQTILLFNKVTLMPLADQPPFPRAAGRQGGWAPLGFAPSETWQHSQAMGTHSPRKEATSPFAPLQKGFGRLGTCAFGGLQVQASQPQTLRQQETQEFLSTPLPL